MGKEISTSDEEIKTRFENLDTLDDLAQLLEIPKSKLYYYAFKANHEDHYKRFDLSKKNGGVRVIHAPVSPLKLLQKKLNQVFEAVYFRKASVHGFIPERSILTNARRHLEKGRKKYIFNADLKDFFPSITRKRVKNLLQARPYNVNPFIADALAGIACYKGFLPQGAPSSPIISNMICAKMDAQLTQLAQANKCVYTRYADDITISTTLPIFPRNIATHSAETNETIAGTDFQEIIKNNGFKLNDKKLRLQSKYRRQEITGLIVNSFPNVPRKLIRQIRAMLFAWGKYGYEAAQKEYLEKYSEVSGRERISYSKVVRGKLEFVRMVKGGQDPVYLKLRKKLAQLDPDFLAATPNIHDEISADLKILTEGPSDWKHIKAALASFQSKGRYNELHIEFREDEDQTAQGDGTLLYHCKLATPPLKVEVCIFDRDNPDIIKHVLDGNNYRKWNPRVYSFAIPVPNHRNETPDVCIELYYPNKDIQRKDKIGRRLFLSDEFHKKSGRHLSEDLNCFDRNKLKGKLTVIDNDVFDSDNSNVALPKNDFATYILERQKRFSSVDFSSFDLIFEMIRRIVRENHIGQAIN